MVLSHYGKVHLMLNGELGYGAGNHVVSVFQYFFAGVIRSRRGTMFVRTISNNRTLGGDKRAVGNREVSFPMPGMKNDRLVRLSAFFDAGLSGARRAQKPTGGGLTLLRGGIAVMWISPMGPLANQRCAAPELADS